MIDLLRLIIVYTKHKGQSYVMFAQPAARLLRQRRPRGALVRAARQSRSQTNTESQSPAHVQANAARERAAMSHLVGEAAWGTLRLQVHLGPAFRAYRFCATTRLAICLGSVNDRQGSRHKFLAVQPHMPHVHHFAPVHLVEL